MPVFAYQSGWGIDGGQLIWDKSFPTRAVTGPTGDFVLHYRVGSSARLGIDLPGYNQFRAFSGPWKRVDIRLKRLLPPHDRLPGGEARFGLREDGRLYGWSFDRKAIASSCADADVIPAHVDRETRGQVLLTACGSGGLRYIPAETLGVRDQFLVYADSAPADGYTNQLLLDFSGRGGIVFVRTRDGSHYAKFAFTPFAFGGFMDPGVVRDVSFTYVYDPGGGRYLPYDMQPYTS
ncbi:MAG TPA: hypothetical protein VLN49_22965 [Gemmatimonadaceae bacterium]|nr:hypothetical protein [Gemmatimonadaceae bacterium]